MQIKNKTKFSLLILAIVACAFVVQFKSEQHNSKSSKPDFFPRFPAATKKARQHIKIDIDYEKLAGRNDIRLIGRVNTEHLGSETLDYKWTLKDNLKLKSGAITGKVNLKDTKEITLDVSIKDMNKKINVRLEAYVQTTKAKLGSVKTFIYDPMNEVVSDSERMEVQSKSLGEETLSKQEFLEKEMKATRKLSHQQ